MNDIIFVHKVRNGTAWAVFLPKFQKPARSYPSNFSKLNYIKPMPQLSRSKYRISARGPPLWNEFLTDSEKETENWSLLKSKLKSKLLSYENEVIFFLVNLAKTHNRDKKVC